MIHGSICRFMTTKVIFVKREMISLKEKKGDTKLKSDIKSSEFSSGKGFI